MNTHKHSDLQQLEDRLEKNGYRPEDLKSTHSHSWSLGEQWVQVDLPLSVCYEHILVHFFLKPTQTELEMLGFPKC